MPLHSSFKCWPSPFEIIFLGDTLNNLGSVGVLRGHHGCQECSPNHGQDRHPEAPISALAQSPILLFKKRVFSSYAVCEASTASGPLSRPSTCSATVCFCYPLWGGGACGGHPEDATESAEKSSWPFVAGRPPSRGQTRAAAPGCPVAFVCAQLSAPVHQPEWAHSGAFMRLGDPGRLDTTAERGTAHENAPARPASRSPW